MRTNDGDRTVTSQVRRRQITDAAARVIAVDGLSRASFTRIAHTAGLSSPGMISYHFADKDELFAVLCDEAIADCAQAIEGAVAAAPGPQEALAAYLTSFIDWQDAHREQVSALRRLAAGWKRPGLDAAFDEGALSEPLRAILIEGAASGALRTVRTEWVIETILCAVEGFEAALGRDLDLDASAFGDELVGLFVHGLEARRD